MAPVSTASGTIAPRTERRQRVLRTGSALVDQLLSSGSGLIVFVLVAHTGSRATMGSVSFALIVNGLLLGTMRAMVGEVALIRSRREGADPRREAQTAVLLALLGSLGSAALLLAVAGLLHNETGRYFALVAIALPFVHVQDVLRYIAYSAKRVGDAIVIDGAWLGVQLVVSTAFFLAGEETPTRLFVAWGIGAAAGALLGLVRTGLRPSREGLGAWWAEDRRRMASFFADYFFSTGIVQASFLALGVVLGRSSFGTFRLGATAVSPLVNAMAGVRVLGLVRLSDRSRDAAAAMRTAVWYGIGLTVAGFGYLLLLSVAPLTMGIDLLGDAWEQARTVALITATGEALRLGSFAATDFVKVFSTGKRLVRTRIIGSVFVVVGALAGGAAAGPEGAALGVGIAAFIGTVIWWAAARAAKREAIAIERDEATERGARGVAPGVLALGWRSADEPLAPQHGLGSGIDQPLDVIHVVARSQLRGAERVAIELAAELDELGHRNRVIAIGLGHDGGRIEGLDALVDSSEVGLGVLWRSARGLRAMLRAQPADVVLAHGGWALQAAIVALPLRRRGQAPQVVWQRILGVPEDLWRGRRHLVWRAAVTRIDAAVALTGDLEEEVRRLGFEGAVWVIPNARRPEKFLAIDRDAAAAQLREELGLAPTVPIIGFVGHLVRQKRPERAVQVLAGVRSAGIPAHLVVAGDGPLRGAVEAEVARLGLDEHVTLLGFRPDVEEVMGASDVLLMTSEAEGIPGVAIESLMTGCPMITFPLGGVSEVVDDGVTGVVLDRFDTVLMARRTAELLQDREQLAAMGAAGRARSAEFAFGRVAATYATQLLALRDGLVPLDEVEAPTAVPYVT